MHSQYVHPKHPPDKEYREDGPRYVNYPVASCFRFPKIEHAAMVAGGLTAYFHSQQSPTTRKRKIHFRILRGFYNSKVWFSSNKPSSESSKRVKSFARAS